jgi:hypothetical protein
MMTTSALSVMRDIIPIRAAPREGLRAPRVFAEAMFAALLPGAGVFALYRWSRDSGGGHPSMRRFLLVAAVVLSSAAGFAIRSLSLKSPAAPAAEASAQQSEEYWTWEYAAVTRAQFAPNPRGGQYWIVYFRGESGVSTTTVEPGVGGNAQAKAIALLGSRNWEMVGEGTLDTGRRERDEPPRALLFKRRLK